MKVHLPSGRVVSVPASVAAAASTLADFCPARAEHTPPQGHRPPGIVVQDSGPGLARPLQRFHIDRGRASAV